MQIFISYLRFEFLCAFFLKNCFLKFEHFIIAASFSSFGVNYIGDPIG